MDLLLSNSNYLDCTYSHNSVPIYSTSTASRKLFRRITKVTKSTSDASTSNQKNPIGQVHWNSLRSNKLVLCGQELKTKWIQTNSKSRPPGNELVHEFQVSGPDGQLYKWGTHPDQTLTLISVSNPTNILARLETPRKPRADILRIAPAGVGMTDFIMLTFIYFKSIIEENHGTSSRETDEGTDDDNASSKSHQTVNEIVLGGADMDFSDEVTLSGGEPGGGIAEVRGGRSHHSVGQRRNERLRDPVWEGTSSLVYI